MKYQVALFQHYHRDGTASFQSVWDRAPSSHDWVRISEWVDVELPPRAADEIEFDRTGVKRKRLENLQKELAALQQEVAP